MQLSKLGPKPMTQVLPAHELLLSEIEDLFNLREILGDPTFFTEWQEPYGLSTELSIHRPDNELYQVLAILKQLIALQT